MVTHAMCMLLRRMCVASEKMQWLTGNGHVYAHSPRTMPHRGTSPRAQPCILAARRHWFGECPAEYTHHLLSLVCRLGKMAEGATLVGKCKGGGRDRAQPEAAGGHPGNPALPAGLPKTLEHLARRQTLRVASRRGHSGREPSSGFSSGAERRRERPHGLGDGRDADHLREVWGGGSPGMGRLSRPTVQQKHTPSLIAPAVPRADDRWREAGRRRGARERSAATTFVVGHRRGHRPKPYAATGAALLDPPPRPPPRPRRPQRGVLLPAAAPPLTPQFVL